MGQPAVRRPSGGENKTSPEGASGPAAVRHSGRLSSPVARTYPRTGKSAGGPRPHRTLNRHRWASRICTGVWKNSTEGTRQTHPITRKGVPPRAQPRSGGSGGVPEGFRSPHKGSGAYPPSGGGRLRWGGGLLQGVPHPRGGSGRWFPRNRRPRCGGGTPHPQWFPHGPPTRLWVWHQGTSST